MGERAQTKALNQQPLYAIPTVFFPAKTGPKQRYLKPNRTKMRQKVPENRPLRVTNLSALRNLTNFGNTIKNRTV
jgi:hypothetical protein